MSNPSTSAVRVGLQLAELAQDSPLEECQGFGEELRGDIHTLGSFGGDFRAGGGG